jgi:hypothetical protein
MKNCQATFCTPSKICQNWAPNVVFNCVSVCKVRKINVKYVTCVCAKRDDQNTVFFFLVNETSFKNEFLLTVFFIDDKFFDINLK